MTDVGVRLVSINIWDLPIHLPGNDRRGRRRRLLDRLPALDADVVLVQEAFRPAFRKRLARAMAGYHVAPDRQAARRIAWVSMDVTGGLMTFSRWPVANSDFHAWRTPVRMRLDERIGRKGAMWTRIDTPAGPLTVVNVHLYAGNGRGDARGRTTQVRELLARRALAGPTVLAGDFNMARELEEDWGGGGFDLLFRDGFREIADGWTGSLATMAPHGNRYAAMIQRVRRDRRLTQVFLRELEPGVPAPSRCLHDPPVSDHYGLLVGLSLT